VGRDKARLLHCDEIVSTHKTAGPGAPSEAAVIAALNEGHREFLRFLTRRTASVADAEDLLQDFYLKVVTSSRTVREEGALRKWLAQVLRRTLADYYRKKGVRARVHARLESERGPALIVDDDAGRAVCSCLYRILPALPDDYGRIIWLVDLIGESRATVAKGLGITPNNLGVRLYRARHALRGALRRFCTTCPTHGFLNCACPQTSPVEAERAWFESQGKGDVMNRSPARPKSKTGVTRARLANRR
jgi:RNA polymerase sigma-70 factor (ECF subfamily)